MGEEYHGEGGETACLVEAGYGRGDVLHHNRTSPGTDGGSYAERNQRSRARNGSDRARLRYLWGNFYSLRWKPAETTAMEAEATRIR